jgi:hypothetical protein
VESWKYLPAVFEDPEHTKHELYISDTWEPPTPPQIQLLPMPTNAWRATIPKSIISTNTSKADTKKTKKATTAREDDDQQTITTAATHMSYSQDVISDLQSDSRQHSLSIEAHTEHFNRIEDLVQTQIEQ